MFYMDKLVQYKKVIQIIHKFLSLNHLKSKPFENL